MRFAYIDSNGNEVPIPSVDALALRIELGAIDENTDLYDAQADQWGPAHTHEIFHTLARAAESGGQGFVAPPPPVAPPRPAEPEPEEPAAVEVEDEGLTLADADSGDQGLTVAEPPPAEESAEEAELVDLDLDLAPAETAETEVPSDDAAESPGFDFGDMGGGLELEQEFEGPDDDDTEPAMDFSMGADVGGEGVGDVKTGGGGLELERPMSEFSPDSPPAWMESEEEEAGDGEVMDFSSVSADVAGTEEPDGEVPLRARRTPRNKPSPAKHRRQRSLVGPIAGVVILLAIGMGGYVAWPILSARLAGRGDPAEPVMVMPAIPAELLPQMTTLAGAAFADAFRDVRDDVGGGAATPSPDWLAGVYLANATRFADVETFWLRVRDVLAGLRAVDGQTFHANYERSMAVAGVSAENGALLLERADSGFVAAAGARDETYVLVDDLIDAALGLHDFLIQNEQNIEYTPASTITSDPVLEAKPSTPEIRQAMEDRIDRVTDALDELDYLDLVTADGLWAAVLTRVREVGIR